MVAWISCIHVYQHILRQKYTKRSVETHPDLEDTRYGAFTIYLCKKLEVEEEGGWSLEGDVFLGVYSAN